jgi:hypothetical protein
MEPRIRLDRLEPALHQNRLIVQVDGWIEPVVGTVIIDDLEPGPGRAGLEWRFVWNIDGDSVCGRSARKGIRCEDP